MKNKPKITICMPGKQFSNIWLKVRDSMIMRMITEGYSVMLKYAYDPNIFIARNKCAQNIDKSCDYVLWLDSDVLASFEVFERLSAYDKDIVAAPYLMQNLKQSVVVKGLMWDTDHVLEYFTKEEVEKNAGLQQVEYVGFGFTLIKADVFRKLQYPWFIQTIVQKDDKRLVLGDDQSFCHQAKYGGGYKIYCDLSTKVLHLKEFPI